MSKITQDHLSRAIQKANSMSIRDKEFVCDEIFIEQPNLLASVLVQIHKGNTIEEVDVLLEILIVLYLALKESGEKIEKISEEEQARQLRIYAEICKFTEGMDRSTVISSFNQYYASQDDRLLFEYIVGKMKDAQFFENQKECS
jgi:hypothetical protein